MGGNNIVDKGKGSGPRNHDYGEVSAEELGTLMQICLLGEASQVLLGQDKVTFANKGGRNSDEEEW